MHIVAWYQCDRAGPDRDTVRFVARGETSSQAETEAWLKRIQDEHVHTLPMGYIWAFDAWETLPRLAPFQERVIADKADLDAKLYALNRFIDGGFSAGMAMQEKMLLIAQRNVMRQYSLLLGERIALYLPRRPAAATTPTESV